MHLSSAVNVFCKTKFRTLVKMANITGLNSCALKTGSPFPEYNNDHIRVYGMRFCPFTQRILLTLSAKNVSFEVVNINLLEKPEWYAKHFNPSGSTPSVQIGEKIGYESLMTARWLDDEIVGELKLMPNCPYEKLKQELLVEKLSKLAEPCHSWYKKQEDADLIESVKKNLKVHEDALSATFYAGDECGWVDYMIWPWLERMEGLAILSNNMLAVSKEQHPKLFSYMERMKNRHEIKRIYRTPEEYLNFLKFWIPGKPDFDVGIAK